ncbi:hypothetical protein L345_14097, partial [Ophiophagus hannah]
MSAGWGILGAENESELALHFNPRFDSQGDVKTIICNSRTCGEWGKEIRQSAFPFQQGEEFKHGYQTWKGHQCLEGLLLPVSQGLREGDRPKVTWALCPR